MRIPRKLKGRVEVRSIFPGLSLRVTSDVGRQLAKQQLESIGLKVILGKHVETCDKTDIALKSNQSEVNTLTGRVTAAESSLIVQSGKIEGLVTKTDGQGGEIGQLKVQSNSIQLQVSELPDYIQSRGQNLVTNGMGSMGTNVNFATMKYDGAEREVGVGSFRMDGFNAAAFTNELIPFDGRRIYEYSYLAVTRSSVQNVLKGLDNSLKGNWGKKAREVFTQNDTKLGSL